MISAKNPLKKKNCSLKTCPLCAKIEYIDTESEKLGIPCSAKKGMLPKSMWAGQVDLP